VIAWIKKAEKLLALSDTLIVAIPNADATVLELDELWPFVLKKTNKASSGMRCIPPLLVTAPVQDCAHARMIAPCVWDVATMSKIQRNWEQPLPGVQTMQNKPKYLSPGQCYRRASGAHQSSVAR